MEVRCALCEVATEGRQRRLLARYWYGSSHIALGALRAKGADG